MYRRRENSQGISFSKELTMKRFGVVILVLAMSCVSLAGWAEEKKTALPDKIIDVRYEKCPISGGKVNENVTLVKNGKVYHFCCAKCIKPFNKDFDAKVKTLVNPKEVALKTTNVKGKCPVSGKPANPEIFRISGDNITFYCCEKCPPKVVVDDDDDEMGSGSGSGAKKDEKPAADKPAD